MSNPPFEPRPGQKDYTNEKIAPVINCLVVCEKRLLLVKRSEKLSFYPGLWHCIAGFLDDAKTPEEKVFEELQEEIGMTKDDIVRIQKESLVHMPDALHHKVWVVQYFVAESKHTSVTLNWEAEAHAWVSYDEFITHKNLVPGFRENTKHTLRKFLT